MMKNKKTKSPILPAYAGGSHVPPGKLHVPHQFTNPDALKMDAEQYEKVKGIVLLTMKQTAALFNVTPQYIYKKIADGLFPAPIKLGTRMVRFKLTDLEQYLETCVTA